MYIYISSELTTDFNVFVRKHAH